MRSKLKVCAGGLIIVALLMCTGCDAVATLKKTLKADHDVWDSMQNDFIAYHKAGKIDEPTWAKINTWDKRIVAIHNMAVELGKTYEITKDKTIYNKILAIIGESAQIIADGRTVWIAFKGGK